MRKQIIGILREQEAGRPTAEVCRRHGVSGATFYKWKSKFWAWTSRTSSG
jgi:putative transposase